MNADGIDIFHVADRDAVSGRVPDDLVLDFLPTGDTALHKDFVHSRKPEAVLENLPELVFIVGNAAAGAAQGIGGTENHRVANLVRKLYAGFHVVNDFRRSDGFSDYLHRILEGLAVLRLLDGLGGRANEADPGLFKEARLCQLHAEVEAGLTAEGGQDPVRLLLQNNLLKNTCRQRLDIDLICNVLVRHDGGRVRVHEADLNPLFLQGPAGLGACVVKLRRLADDDGAGADHQNFFNA